MATQKQINANRQNAQKSTGPSTVKGKAAVSQNAVKHAIFADSIITGENEADYEAYHDEMFAELDAVGAVELMLAERVVNLSWRLKRAERVQNQVIEDMIGRIVTNDPARRDRECYYINKGIMPGDPGMDLDDLPLGRIATHDWSSCRVIDRMLMYERRIENSMMKTMRELERRQLIRQVEQQCESEQADHITINDNRDKAATRNPTAQSNGDLKKQSQYVQAMIGLKPFLKGDYGKESPAGDEQNKANQSQFCAPANIKGVGKREILPEAATG